MAIKCLAGNEISLQFLFGKNETLAIKKVAEARNHNKGKASHKNLFTMSRRVLWDCKEKRFIRSMSETVKIEKISQPLCGH